MVCFKGLSESFRGWFQPPLFPDEEEKTRQALFLHKLLWVLLSILLVLTILGVPFFYEKKTVGLLFTSSGLLAILISWKLMRRGFVRLAGKLIVATFWGLVILLILLGSGFRDANMVLLITVIVIAGLLLGRRAVITVSLVTVLSLLIMALLENTGYLPIRYLHPSLAVGWIQVTMAIITTIATLNIALRSNADSLRAARERLNERQQVKKALQISEEQYQNIFENAEEGLFQIALDGRFININPTMARVFGYDSTIEMIEHSYMAPFHHHTTPEPRQLLIQELKKRGLLIHYEQKMERKDGDTIWVSINARTVKDDLGRPLYYEGSLVDITDRKQTEEALRDKQARIQEAYRLAHLGAWSWTKATPDVWEWSDGMYEIFGFDPNLPPPPMAVHRQRYTQDVWKQRTKVNRQILETGMPQQMEMEITSINGTRHWISTYCGPRYNAAGEIIGLNGTIQDITDRKNAEEALRRSEARYRLLAENARDIIWTTDMNLQFTYVSPSVQQLLGYAPDELRQSTLLAILTPASQELALAYFNQEMEMEKLPDKDPFRSVIFEIDNIHRDGRPIPCELRAAFLRESSGQPLGILGVTRDITERHRTEVERKKWEGKLIQAQKLEAVGTLAGGVAHDFNNLLMGIQGYASLMLLNLDAGHPHYEPLRNIEQQVQSGANLTRQLLGYARGGKYEIQSTNMNRFLQQNSRLFGRTKKEIVIAHNFEPDLWRTEIDRTQLDQVFLNLYINAWHAMPAGGELTISTQNVTLDANSAKALDLPSGRYIDIAVRDTGVGMDEKTRVRIFDPFFTTKEMGRGSGLGLASAYGILRNHGGMITVYSEKGVGTVFHIYLPASDSEAAPEEKAAAVVAKIVEGHETILVIDDEQANLSVAEGMLKSMGYTVFVAASGQEALELYSRQHDKIQIIILDMIMPGMSGSETFDGLQTIDPQARIILSSGYSISGQAQKIMERGAKAFLQKPYKMEELSVKIRKVLDHHS